ncbi:hypothetical protein WSS15_17420 [Acetobacter pasteurianus]|nr:hypothetical protein WSS15_17420 [Acetobacter pasteurianus]
MPAVVGADIEDVPPATRLAIVYKYHILNICYNVPQIGNIINGT